MHTSIEQAALSRPIPTLGESAPLSEIESTQLNPDRLDSPGFLATTRLAVGSAFESARGFAGNMADRRGKFTAGVLTGVIALGGGAELATGDDNSIYRGKEDPVATSSQATYARDRDCKPAKSSKTPTRATPYIDSHPRRDFATGDRLYTVRATVGKANRTIKNIKLTLNVPLVKKQQVLNISKIRACEKFPPSLLFDEVRIPVNTPRQKKEYQSVTGTYKKGDKVVRLFRIVKPITR